MRTLLLALTASVLGAPGAQAGDVWVSLQAGLQRHHVNELEATRDATAGLDVEFQLGRHVAVRSQLAYVHTGGGLHIRGSVQSLDLHFLDGAAVIEASLPLSYGDRLYILAGPALGIRMNTPDTLTGPLGNLPPPPTLELSEGWRRLSLSAVLGGGLAIRPRGSRMGTFFELQYRRTLSNLYGNPNEFVQYEDRSRGWRFVTGLSLAVR